MQNDQKEVYAIDDDDIDIRLIQRQIENVVNQFHKKIDSSPQSSKVEADTSQENEDSSIADPLLKNENAQANRAFSEIKSNADSMDINELMNDANSEISLDMLDALTNKITSSLQTNEENTVTDTNTDTDANANIDESEEIINNIEEDTEHLKEETINQDNEKTIVTDQICEYPLNTFDSGYIQTLNYLEGNKRYKKFVIYIDEENIDYITSLSVQERKDIINSILREQDDQRICRIQYERKKKLIAHLMIGIITFFLCVPLLYLVINKCLEATISNYQRSQNNFEVLYKVRGKIKTPSP